VRRRSSGQDFRDRSTSSSITAARDCHSALGGASLLCSCAFVGRGVIMAGTRIKGSALPKWQHTQYGADARRDDAFSTWSPEQLARMDSDFCTRVEIAFRAGGESMSAAAATYDLPGRRRAT
jgi:hypothetical protein